MNPHKIVKMANQIAAHFATEPVRAEAVAGVASHLKRFWEPRLRRELLARFDQAGTEGLHELVVAALQQHRGELEPARQ